MASVENLFFSTFTFYYFVQWLSLDCIANAKQKRFYWNK